MGETGVGAIFSASHKDHLTGEMHGHSYEVIAWFTGGDRDARVLQRALIETLLAYDHKTLTHTPWAETMARDIKSLLGCVEVEIRRPLERIYARAK